MMPPHRCYVEVFGGAAWVLALRKALSDAEVHNDISGNDINSELVNFSNVIKYRWQEFISPSFLTVFVEMVCSVFGRRFVAVFVAV